MKRIFVQKGSDSEDDDNDVCEGNNIVGNVEYVQSNNNNNNYKNNIDLFDKKYLIIHIH